MRGTWEQGDAQIRDWTIKRSYDQKFPKISSNFSLFGYLRADSAEHEILDRRAGDLKSFRIYISYEILKY